MNQKIENVFEIGSDEVEADFVSSDGTRTPYFFNGVRFETRGEFHLLGVGIDVSELKATSQSLKESRANLEIFIRLAPVALAIFGREMRYVAVSNRWLSDYKIESQDIIGKSHYEVFDDIPSRWKDVYRRAMAGEEIQADEDCFLRSNGTIQWLHWKVSPWRDQHGSIGGIVIFSEDITRRRDAEERTAISEERLRLALSAAQMGIFDWDLSTNKIVWSGGHEKLWGFAPGEFDGTYKTFESRVHVEDIDSINAEVARCMAQRATFSKEFRVVWPDQSTHWIAGTGEFEFDALGKAVRMRGVVTETTARKQLEQQYYHAQRMEAIGQLAGGISHDFNNLLTVIGGMAELTLLNLSRVSHSFEWSVKLSMQAGGQQL